MPKVRLTRAVQFSAAHRYFRPDWSDEQNRGAFGACANEHGHGHTYKCFVTVLGPISQDTSMVFDLARLDEILREEVLDPLDHQHINHAIPEFHYGQQIPTAEALAAYLWGRIVRRIPDGVELISVRVQEGPDLFAEYCADE